MALYSRLYSMVGFEAVFLVLYTRQFLMWRKAALRPP